MTSTRARLSRPVGLRAEAVAENYLVARGYRVLERNHHSQGGEVDLIVALGEWVVFVEVKARKRDSRVDAVTSVTPAKQRKIVKAALHFVQEHGLEDRAMRFDVVAIALPGRGATEGTVTAHLEGAFDASVLDSGGGI